MDFFFAPLQIICKVSFQQTVFFLDFSPLCKLYEVHTYMLELYRVTCNIIFKRPTIVSI